MRKVYWKRTFLGLPAYKVRYSTTICTGFKKGWTISIIMWVSDSAAINEQNGKKVLQVANTFGYDFFFAVLIFFCAPCQFMVSTALIN